MVASASQYADRAAGAVQTYLAERLRVLSETISDTDGRVRRAVVHSVHADNVTLASLA